MYYSMVRAEEWGSRLPSTDLSTPHLPSHHRFSPPCRVIVRKTPTELQRHLGSCCHTHPCTIVFYNLNFAARPKLGGRRHFEREQQLQGRNYQQKMLRHFYIWRQSNSCDLQGSPCPAKVVRNFLGNLPWESLENRATKSLSFLFNFPHSL